MGNLVTKIFHNLKQPVPTTDISEVHLSLNAGTDTVGVREAFNKGSLILLWMIVYQ